MQIFGNQAFVNTMQDYSVHMQRTHKNHMGPLDSPYAGSGKNIVALGEKIGADGITRANNFDTVMLQALDKVSGAQQRVSALEKEAIINPDAVDVHDITIAQAEANMALGITRNVLNRMVQGWREIINTR